MNVTEGNKLIAEFMGLEKVEEKTTVVYGNNMRRSHEEDAYFVNGVSYGVSGLQYPYNWSWIMPVLQKIAEDTGYELVIRSNHSYWNRFGEKICREYWGYESGPRVVFEAVVEFLKFHRKLEEVKKKQEIN